VLNDDDKEVIMTKEQKKALIDKLIDIYTDELIYELQLRDVVVSRENLASVCSELATEDFQILCDAQNAAEEASWRQFREFYRLIDEDEEALNERFQVVRYEIGY
jgi:hypothetical protein